MQEQKHIQVTEELKFVILAIFSNLLLILCLKNENNIIYNNKFTVIRFAQQFTLSTIRITSFLFLFVIPLSYFLYNDI